MTDEGLDIGSSVTLSSLLSTLKACVASRPRHQTSALRAMAEQLKYFAGKPWLSTLLGQLPSSGLKWRACRGGGLISGQSNGLVATAQAAAAKRNAACLHGPSLLWR